MSLVPLSGNEILVDTPESANLRNYMVEEPGTALVAWVMQRVTQWENLRERGYARKWANYWRLWRGMWDTQDQTRGSERSRVITPALAQAIEASVAEVEEAVFARAAWVDVDSAKTDKKDLVTALLLRDQYLDDAEKVNVKGAVSESVLNAAIFGTGILQINTELSKESRPKRDPKTQRLVSSTRERVVVSVESIRPDEFIPDPAGTRVDQMLGVAVKRVKPQHFVLEMIEKGVYLDSALPYALPQQRLLNRDIDKEVDPQSQITVVDADNTEIVEYHGKVPLGLLRGAMNADDMGSGSLSGYGGLFVDDSDSGGSDDEQLVEAVVTIMNSNVLLRASENNNTMHDRAIIAFQWETVPGRFWGRGVAEKGYNAQVALDASVRSYVDTLGFVSAPMMGVDSGRLPRGFKNAVYPGKVWVTNGNPNDALQTIQIGKFEPGLFQQASEFERMVQMGTGAFDTATALNQQSQSGANSVSANSMLMGAFVKRAKRVVQNVDRHLLTPLVTKMIWRYMQHDPLRYPTDFDFVIKATMGIVAREAENMQLTQLIGMMPDEFHDAKLVVAKGIIENTSISNKHQIVEIIEKALQGPTPEQQQQAQQAQQMQQQLAHATLEKALLDNQLTIATIRETVAKADMETQKKNNIIAQLDQERERLQQEWTSLNNQHLQMQISAAKLPIEHMKAKAAMISANKRPSGSLTSTTKRAA